jgi:hypothetical protein
VPLVLKEFRVLLAFLVLAFKVQQALPVQPALKGFKVTPV